jgi:hypothetical protein
VARDFLERSGLLQQMYRMTFVSREAGRVRLDVPPDQVTHILRREQPVSYSLMYWHMGLPHQAVGLDPIGLAYCSVKVATSTLELTPPSWVPLIESMAATVPLAIAGINDSDYTGWQRCKRPQDYLRDHGPIDSFRIIRPLPPPLEDIDVLDTSGNPGRMDSIASGPAFVCADLWLGPTFWQYAPCRKDEVLNQPCLEVRDTPHFLYIKVYPEPFTRPDGEQGEIQRRLWQLLFHSDCRWPPTQGDSGSSDDT